MTPSTFLMGIAAVAIGFLVGGALMGTNWVAVADPDLEWVFVFVGLAFLCIPCWLFSRGLLTRLARWLILVLAVATAACLFGIGFFYFYWRRHAPS